MKRYNDSYLFTANIYSNVYAAWYKFIKDEFKIESEIGVTLDSWSELYNKSNVYSAIFSELVCIVSKYPKRIYTNVAKRLHNPTGAAVAWGHSREETKFDGYYINGRNLPSWIWTKEIKKEDFINEKNSDIKGGIYEVLGQKKMMELLGAKEIDVRQIVHKNGDIETVTLLKTKEKFIEIDNQPFSWVKIVCPSTGTQYLQGVEPKYNNALDAIASLSPFKSEEYSFDFRS